MQHQSTRPGYCRHVEECGRVGAMNRLFDALFVIVLAIAGLALYFLMGGAV